VPAPPALLKSLARAAAEPAIQRVVVAETAHKQATPATARLVGHKVTRQDATTTARTPERHRQTLAQAVSVRTGSAHALPPVVRTFAFSSILFALASLIGIACVGRLARTGLAFSPLGDRPLVRRLLRHHIPVGVVAAWTVLAGLSLWVVSRL
jgi:hypothetical protein